MFVSRTPAQPPRPHVKRTGRPPGGGGRPRELRVCPRHGEKPFGHYSRGSRGGFCWRCTKCVAEAVTRRHQKVKGILVEEHGGCCAVCGYDRTVVNLHFHHVDPSTKSFAVNMARGKSLAVFRAEAAKCALVCANCHGEIEAGLIPSPPPGAKYGEPWEPVERAVVSPPDLEPASVFVQDELFPSAADSASDESPPCSDPPLPSIGAGS